MIDNTDVRPVRAAWQRCSLVAALVMAGTAASLGAQNAPVTIRASTLIDGRGAVADEDEFVHGVAGRTPCVEVGKGQKSTGAGPIGALSSIYASALGARIFISEVNPVRAALARSLDVGEVLDPSQVDLVEAIKNATGGIGVDVVLECSGNERALQSAFSAVRSAGRITQVGLHTRPASIDPMVLAQREITYNGTWCFPLKDWPRIIDLIARRELPIEKVVTAEIGVDDLVEKGFEVLLSPTGGQVKVLVNARQDNVH